VDTLLELGHSLANGSSTDGSEALDVHVVSEGDENLLDLLGELTGGGEDESLGLLDGNVDGLEDRDGEGRGLAGSGLSLSDNVVTL
jgi:hypothetical protein